MDPTGPPLLRALALAIGNVAPHQHHDHLRELLSIASTEPGPLPCSLVRRSPCWWPIEREFSERPGRPGIATRIPFTHPNIRNGTTFRLHGVRYAWEPCNRAEEFQVTNFHGPGARSGSSAPCAAPGPAATHAPHERSTAPCGSLVPFPNMSMRTRNLMALVSSPSVSGRLFWQAGPGLNLTLLCSSYWHSPGTR